MKWKWKWFAALLVVCAFAFLGYGCTTEAAKETRTVKFLNGGEVFYEETVEWGNEFSFPENDPLPADPEDGYLYTFEGWTASENYNEYRDELVTETFPVYKDEVLYSVFSREKKGDGPVEAKYLVEFVLPNDPEIFGDYAGMILNDKPIWVNRGDSAEEPDHSTFPEITGYHFVEWDRSFDNVRGRLRVTAVYAKNHYRLTRHYLGEEITEDVEYKGDLTWDPVEGVADAFVFDGWYLDEGFGEEADLAEMPAGDLDVYAKYHIDIGPATVLSEGTMAYGDESNSLYVSGMRQAAGLVYTFTWTVNGRQQSVKDRIFSLRNAGNYEVSVHLNANFKDGLLTAEADAKNESSEVFHFSVSQAALTVSASLRESSIVYGSGSPQVDLTYTGFVLNDTAQSLSINPEYTYYRGSDPVTGNLTVGSYTVETHIPTLQNYSVTDPEALPFSVTKRPLHVYLADASLTYGDAFAPVLSYDEFAYDDSASDLGAHTFKRDGAAVSEGDLFDAGTHAVTVEGFASTEYEIILPEAATFTVAKRAITARTTAEGCTYGGEPTLGYVPENVLERDLAYFAESVTYTFLKEGAPYEKAGLLPAGSYTATAVLKDNQNYEIAPSAPAPFTVGKQALTVGVSIDRADASYVYGTSPQVTITYEGFVDGDNESAVTGTPRFTYFDEEGAAYERISFVVGSYTVSVANTLSAANYELSYTSTSFEITKAPLTLTVSIEDSELVYGERPAASIGYAGFVNNETPETVFGHTMPAISYSRDDGKPVEGFHAGTYTATASATAQNYEITVQSASFTIEKAPLTVTVAVSSLTYGDKVTPVVTFDGFKNSESETALGGTRTFNYKKDGAEYEARDFFEAGSYTVVAGGYTSDDYTISYSEGSFEVAKAALTVKVTEVEDFADFTYGYRFVELSHILEGLVANDEEADLGTLTYTVNGQSYTEESLKSERLHAAEYSLAATGLTSSNYDITYVYGGKEASTAEFTVSARQVTLTVESGWSIYAEDKKPYNWYTLSGESILDKELTFAVALRKNGEAYETNEPYFSVGKYETVITFEENSDYALTVSGGTRERGTITHSFTVSPRPFSLSLNGSHKWADRANWSFTPAFGDDGLGFKFVGTVVFANAESAAADEYTAQNVEQFGKTFQWKEGSYKILHDGTDVTANFNLVYQISLILDTSDFNITLPDASETSFVYDAQEHFFPVKATAEGVTAEKITCLYRIGDDHGVFGETYTIRNAGKYTVYVQISAPNCETAKRHFDINVEKANFTVQAPEQSYTYNKGDQGVEITVHAIGDDGFTILYNEKENGDQYTETVAQFSNAATHTVNYRVTGNENYNDAEGQYNIIIAKAQVTAPTISHATYNKAEQKANVSDTDDYNVTTNEGGTDAGSYDVVLTLKDSANYRWSNGNSEPLTLQFVIDKAPLTKPTENLTSFTFTGNAQTYTPNAFDATTMSIKDNVQTNAGTHPVEVSITNAENYRWSDEEEEATPSVLKFNFVIGKAQAVIDTSKITFGELVQGDNDHTYSATYKGAAYEVDWSKATSNFGTVTNDAAEIRNAKTYTVTLTVADSENWNGTKQEFTITINKAKLTVKLPETTTWTYDKTAHNVGIVLEGFFNDEQPKDAVTYTYYNSNLEPMEHDGPSFKNAGTYFVSYQFKQFENYEVVGLSERLEYTIKIEKAVVELPEIAHKTYNGQPQTADVTGNEIYEVTANNGGTDVNNYPVTLTLTEGEGANYKWKDHENENAVTLQFVIDKAQAVIDTSKITFDDLVKGGDDHTYSATYKAEVFDIDWSKATSNFGEVTNDATEIKNANTYTVTLTVEGTTNYDGATETFTITINKAKAVAELSSLGEIARFLNMKLKEVPLPDGYYLAEDGERSVDAGQNSVSVYYNPDEANYENSDPVTVTFTARSEKITVRAEALEADFGVAKENLADVELVYSFTGENGRVLTEEELAYVKSHISAVYQNGVEFTVGGTYLAVFKPTLNDEGGYYTLANETFTIVYKLKSVEYSGVLYTIEDALATATDGEIVVKNDTAFATKEVAEEAGYSVEGGHYTVKAGVTLFLPYDTTQDTARKVGESGAETNTTGLNGTTQLNKTYSSLGDKNLCDLTVTVPAGIELTNAGTLNIGGITSGGGGGASPAGQTNSGYAQLVLGANAKLTSTGTMNIYGFIEEESADNGSKVVIQSGTTTIPFVVVEHRGGTKFSAIYDYMVAAPFNRFYLQNITSTYEVHSGATLLAHANMYASSHDNTADVKFIGGARHFVQLLSDSYVSVKYDVKSKVTKWDCYGSITINALTLTVIGVDVGTAGLMFPVSWYHNFVFHTNGAPATVTSTSQDMKILPGGSITIDKDVTFKIKKLFVYDDKFVDPATSTGDVAAPKYETENGAKQKLGAGKLVVNGTLEAEELGGLVETTGDGATLIVTTAKATSYELITAVSVKWKSYTASTSGKIWSNNGSLSGPQPFAAGTYTSKDGGWITDDSTFGIEFDYVYKNETGDETVTPEGTPNPNNSSAFPKKGMELRDATLDGFEFMGWFTDESCTQEIKNISAEEYSKYLEVGSKLKLYGKFQKLPEEVTTYTVVFHANGDGAVIRGEETLTVNIRSDRLEEFELTEYVPERKNYNFTHWTTDANGNGEKTTLNAADFAGGALNLYAQWEVKTFTLSFSPVTLENGSTASVTFSGQTQAVKQGSSFQVPAGATVKLTITLKTDTALNSVTSNVDGLVATSEDQEFIMPEGDVSISIETEDTGWCLVEGTLVNLADGTQKKVEDLTMDDVLLVYNHYTGKYEGAKLLFNAHANLPAQPSDVITLHFANGTKLRIANEHAFFDLDVGGYVFINAKNLGDYIGHRFASVEYVNGEAVESSTVLVGGSAKREIVKIYSPVTIGNLNTVAEGILALTAFPGQSRGFVNYFEYEEGTMKYDEAKMQADIEKYGLYTYEDFKALMPEEMFYAAPWAYFKVAVGKGLLTWDEIVYTLYYIYETNMV